MELLKPLKYTVKLAEKYFLGDSKRFLYLHFELMEPNLIDFRAGQYVSMKVSDRGERRSYSIASTPDVKHGFALVVDIEPEGVGSKYLKSLKPGNEVEVLAPIGRLAVKDKGRDNLLFVATGSGIVPLYCMIRDLLINKNETRSIRLHWGMRYEKDIFWLDNLERLMEEHSNFVFDFVLSKPNDGWKLCWGRVQDCISRDIKNLKDWEAYLCGNQEMIAQVKELIVSKGINEKDVYIEEYY